jgi:hypothetical protein
MGARDLDLSIYKNFLFGESKALRFDVSAYDATNKAQFGMPTVQVDDIERGPAVRQHPEHH